MYQSLFMALQKNNKIWPQSRSTGLTPKYQFAFFCKTTHNFIETWSQQPSSPVNYQSLFTALKIGVLGELLGGGGCPPKLVFATALVNWYIFVIPSHIDFVLSTIILPGEHPGILPLCLFLLLLSLLLRMQLVAARCIIAGNTAVPLMQCPLLPVGWYSFCQPRRDHRMIQPTWCYFTAQQGLELQARRY